MDWTSLRRIVTGDNADGRSAIVIDGGAAKTIAVDEAGLAEIWTAAFNSDDLLSGDDRLTSEDLSLEPAKGALKVRWFTIAPEDENKSPEEREQAVAFGFAAVQASHARVDTSRHPGMHKTDTLDVIILVRGAVDLLLDDGEATPLRPGDVVIQRATNHAWLNRSDETALLVAVLIRAD